MKAPAPNRPKERGTVLYTTIIVVAIVAVGLASYLTLSFNQQRSVAHSGSWNEAIPVAESGVEEGLAQINTSRLDSSFVANGWTLVGDDYVKKVSIGNNTYVSKVSRFDPPTIEATGFVPIPGGDGTLKSRAVQVETESSSLFTKAMAAKAQIDLSGNNVESDSFDSEDSNYSTAGLYDPLKRKSNGDIATNGDFLDSLNVGDANIYGRIATGPGGTVAIGSNGSVGDETWHSSGNTGIQSGYSNDDMNVSFPDVQAPYTTGGLPPKSNLTIGGVTYSYVLDEDRDYSLSAIRLAGQDGPILVTGKARLYVAGNVSLSGKAGIVIAPDASLNMYVAGSTAELTGQGVVNGSGIAENFRFWGLPSNTGVKLSGNAEFTGTIYAPSAHLHLGGGGNTITDFIGSSVSNTVQMNGHFRFHYDEALGRIQDQPNYIVTSWNEVTPSYSPNLRFDQTDTTSTSDQTVALK